jgi:branched-chain amino acid transport system permease protein
MLAGQLVFDGFAMGLVFVILATGLVLLASVNKIIFMAYGMFYTIGAYVTWYLVHYLSMPYFPALLIGVLGSGGIGALSYLLIFARLSTIEGGFLASLIASMGLQMALSQGGLLVFGTVPRSIPTVFPGTFTPLGIHISMDKLVLIAAGVLVCVALFLIYTKTRLGRSMQAVSFVPEAAALQGIDANMVNLITMTIACGVAGIAGGLLAPSYGINPQMGNTIIWTVMLMSMLGGMDSLIGAVFGGIVIGQLLSFGQFYIGGTVQIVIFIIIGIILYFKPNGLMGHGIDIGI